MAHKALVIGGAAVGAIALVAIVTNPSLANFKDQRAAEDGLTGITCVSVQTGNYVVYSRYEYRCMMSTTKFVGAFGNYYQIKDDAKQPA
jgi:hypothetical protein